MKIEEALFIQDGSSERMDLEDIKNHQDFVSIKNHLYCATPGCECPLIYANGQNPYLRTFPKQNHSTDCPYSLQRIEAQKRNETEEVVKRGLSGEEIQTKHKYAFAKYFGPSEKKNNNKQNKNNISKTITSNSETKKTVPTSPTLDSVKTANNSKTKSIQTNHLSINEIDDKNIGKVVNIVGTVSYVNYDTKKNIFILKLENYDNYEITFPESYLASTSNKDALKKSFVGVSKLSKKKTVVCCITTYLQKLNGKYQLPIYNIANLSFGILENEQKTPSPLNPLRLMEIVSRQKLI
ncbi:hypothetical protein [Staphylococcus epidermidis]|uniref:hypothetical protein n=1 Tax=Staphylococcus epidermidis TaxID=1282 RepID=UPI0018798D1B|nr:hypothetical protein [Staphylococcus epidermidis]MBE7320083.1 hypothetical protein [Staphylococcus epidermidis]